MSLELGLSAINLEMPSRVPRVEADAHVHWKLVSAVTGLRVGPDSPASMQQRASEAFVREWDYDLMLSGTIFADVFGEMRTSMGHAAYAAGGVDYRDDLHCPFDEPEEVLAFDPWEVYGERDKAEIVKRFNEHYRNSTARFPDLVSTAGVYVTLFSGLIDIFGWEMLLLAGGIDPEGFGEVANRYASWAQQYYDALAESDVPFIYSHDDIVWTRGAVFHPDWYRNYIFPNLRCYYEPLITAGKKIIFVADGNYNEFVDDIADTGIHGFYFEPLTSLELIAEKYGQTHVMIGNVDTRVLLSGTKQRIRGEVERCMDVAGDCPGYFMCVSNMIPANTPVENALYYNEVYEELSKR